ncbi:hypothetical protein ACS0TY_016528 [Phlomoides rotata]
MKRKKQKQVTFAPQNDGELEYVIHSHGEFFDHLIELIPAKFYLPSEDAESKPWYKGLSKAAKASLKQKSRENLKVARRHRFDPEGEPSSTLQLLHNQQNSKSSVAGNAEDGESQGKPIDVEEDKEKSVTYEELRERLRRKIELLRGNRGESSRNYEKKVKYEGKKRKKGDESDGGESGKGASLDEDEDAEEIIEYGKVRLGDEDEGKRGKNKKRKLSKSKELEKVKKKEEVKKENPTVAERESWKAATSRAMGIKVHDDARLIKDSMKREKRKKEKNAEKWKERAETQEKMKEERQKKRRENIAGRINEKKTRRIAKREKKLMRPGFEGRKEGFITKE